MEAHAQEASKAVNAAAKKLQNALEQKEIDYPTLEPLLEKYRVYTGNYALLTYFMTEQSAESSEKALWEWHVKVNSKFKLLLKSFRDGPGKKKHVERRKAEKLYSDFIKASQRFFRAYIQRLAANFTQIPKVHEIARILGQNTSSSQPTKAASQELRDFLERSCKQTVVRLGDLSRWRETELSHKDRNWGPAIGYYQFALSLDPSDGVCYNQLAVIAAHDNNHLDAVYYMHRAATVEHRFPTAIDNLKLKFDKLIKGGSEDTLGTLDMSDDVIMVLQKRVLAFHAECYSRPHDFVTFSQKASDVVNLIAIGFEETQDQRFDVLLSKMCLINIAAEAIAKQGTKESLLQKQLSGTKLAQEIDRSCQSYFLLQRFNMITFQALLKVLSRELGDVNSETVTSNPANSMLAISQTVRRVLPLLRQYSSWLLSNMRDLICQKFKSSRVVMQQVLKSYIQALNLLADSFDFMAPNPIDYLLPEDEDTVSFTPFSPFVHKQRFTKDGSVKSAFVARRNTKLIESEIHLRGIDLLLDGLRLATQKDELELNDTPVKLEGTKFAYQDVPEPAPIEVPPSPPKKLWRSRAHVHASSMNGSESPGLEVVQDSQAKPTVHPERVQHTQSQSLGVTNLDLFQSGVTVPKAGATETEKRLSKSPSQPVANIADATSFTSHNTQSGMTAMDLVRQMQRSSVGTQFSENMRTSPTFAGVNASLPSIFQTPFVPTAAEASELASRPGTAHRASPPNLNSRMTSSGAFQEQIDERQKQIHMRSSPQSSFQPTLGWDTFGTTSTNADPMFRNFQHSQSTLSPFSSPTSQSHGRPSPKQSSQASMFGAIGERPPVSRNTPTSG